MESYFTKNQSGDLSEKQKNIIDNSAAIVSNVAQDEGVTVTLKSVCGNGYYTFFKLECQTFISSQTFLKEYIPFAFEHSIVDAANDRHMPYIRLSIDRDGDKIFDWASEAGYYKYRNSTEVDGYQTWLNND